MGAAQARRVAHRIVALWRPITLSVVGRFARRGGRDCARLGQLFLRAGTLVPNVHNREGADAVATDSRTEAIERATGRSWHDWLAWFDSIGAAELDHHTIATHLLTELGGMVDNLGWWAQSTAVAYEHHIGRRIPGQQPDGTFRLSVSRTTSLSMLALMDAWVAFAADAADVQSLLAAAPRVSGTDKRITWRVKGTDDTAITVISEPKPNGAASIVVQHGGLASPEAVAETKAVWLAVVDRFLAAHP